MLHLKTNPSGFDVPINKFAQELYSPLMQAWELSTDKFEAYGRVYKLRDKDGFKPYHFRSETVKDYREVLWNDKYAAMFFFDVDEDIRYAGAYGFVDVHLVFFTDMSKLNGVSENPYRGDVEVRKTVFNKIRYPYHGFALKGESFGTAKTLAEYTGVSNEDHARFDMHPRHCFRFDFQLRFNP